MLLILGLVLFVALVVVHEFGHFVVARRNGVEVEEFGIGFPPTIWKKRIKSPKGDYDFTINLLPLGGFVKLKGEHDSDTKKGTFGAASLKTKIKVMVAGVGMNLLAAFMLLTLLAIIGMPKLLTKDTIGEDQYTIARDTKVIQREVLVSYVEPGSPADKAGLKLRDHLDTITPQNGPEQVIESQDSFPSLTKKYAGQNVKISYTRGNQQATTNVQLRTAEEVEASKKTSTTKGYLGISPTQYEVRRSTWSAPIVAGGLIGQFSRLTFQGIGHALGGLFTGNTAQASEQVSGPVGIFFILKDGGLLGYKFILMIIAIISLTLALMNILPIPALDGGRLFVTLLFRAIKKPLQPNVEDWIHGSGFALLMILFVLITIVDVKRFF
jgi:regulator of sigma E protease